MGLPKYVEETRSAERIQRDNFDEGLAADWANAMRDSSHLGVMIPMAGSDRDRCGAPELLTSAHGYHPCLLTCHDDQVTELSKKAQHVIRVQRDGVNRLLGENGVAHYRAHRNQHGQWHVKYVESSATPPVPRHA